MKRVGLVLQCAAILLLCSAAGCLSHLWKDRPLTWDVASTALIVPAISGALFLCISFAFPDLYAVDRLRWPLNVTLPIVYAAIILLTMTLVSRVGPSIMRMPDRLDVITVWANPWVLGTTLLAGIACFSVLAALGNESPKER